MNAFRFLTLLFLFVTPLATILALDCGGQGCDAPCSSGNCYNGSTVTPSAVGIDTIVTTTLFDQMLKFRNDPRCKGNGFYTYAAFINAARKYNGFGTTGSIADQRRELAAFFAQTSHETTGGWAGAPDGQFAWGYCFVRETHPQSRYCDSKEWPCPQSYIGRGPIQLSHNYNYGLFGRSIGRDLINNPDLLATDPALSFQSAIWFWMTPQGNKPSSHDVITGRWTPSAADRSAGRVSGFGVITNIINGGLECGHGRNENVEDRIGFYRRYCNLLGVSPGNYLDCYTQKPFG